MSDWLFRTWSTRKTPAWGPRPTAWLKRRIVDDDEEIAWRDSNQLESPGQRLEQGALRVRGTARVCRDLDHRERVAAIGGDLEMRGVEFDQLLVSVFLGNLECLDERIKPFLP